MSYKLIILFLLCICSACTALNTRSIASNDDCLTSINNYFELSNQNYYRPLTSIEIKHKEVELSSITEVLNSKTVDFQYVEIFSKIESHYAIEVLPTGNHMLAKFLRRIKPFNSDLKFFFSKTLTEDGEVAYYSPAINSIVLGEQFLKYLSFNNKDFMLATLSHETRHAQFDLKLKKESKNDYTGIFLRAGGTSKDTYYDDLFSLEEVYTYLKESRFLYSRHLKKTRRGESTIILRDQLDFKVKLGRALAKRALRQLKEIKHDKPNLVVDDSSAGRFLAYKYTLENNEKEFLYFIRSVEDDETQLKEEDQIKYYLKAKNEIEKQITRIENDLKEFQKLERIISED